MPPSRLQWHLAKCPDKARCAEEYAICPYNATHIMIKSELSNHLGKCKDKQRLVAQRTEEDEQLEDELQKYLASTAAQKAAPTQPSTGRGRARRASDSKEGEGENHSAQHNQEQRSQQPQQRQAQQPHKQAPAKQPAPKSGSQQRPPQQERQAKPPQQGRQTRPQGQQQKHNASPKNGKVTENVPSNVSEEEALAKKIKMLQKRLKQITVLEEKQKQGGQLDADQLKKITRKSELEDELSRLESKSH